MLSLAHSGKYYQFFLSQGIGIGIGIGVLFVPSISVVTHYFMKRRAIAMGIVLSGSSLGAIVHTVILNKLLYRIHLDGLAIVQIWVSSTALYQLC